MNFQENRLFKRILLLVLCLCIILPQSGCAGNSSADLAKSGSEADESTITVTDCAGRTVEVPADVERIACMYAFTGHVVAMLGKGDKLVAVVEGLKRDKIMTQLLPSIESACVPYVSGAINIEELVKADPDLVFIRMETAINPGETAKLDECGIPYLVSDYTNMAEQQYAIEMMGKAIGASDEAAAYNDYYREAVERVRERASKIPQDEKVRIYHSVNEAVRTDVKDTLPADWIDAVGAVNVSINEDLRMLDNSYYATIEQIYVWDPEVILANETGVADYILANEKWASLRAVKNNKVYQMPNGISRWGHPGSLETPLAVLWTAKILYPEKFQDIDMAKETKAYYSDFFGMDLDGGTVEMILSGNGMRVTKEELSKE